MSSWPNDGVIFGGVPKQSVQDTGELFFIINESKNKKIRIKKSAVETVYGILKSQSKVLSAPEIMHLANAQHISISSTAVRNSCIVLFWQKKIKVTTFVAGKRLRFEYELFQV